MYKTNKQIFKIIVNDTVNRGVPRVGTRPSLSTMSRGTVNSDRAWQWYEDRAPRKHMTADLMREKLRQQWSQEMVCCTSVDACWQEVRLCSGWRPVPFPQCIYTISSESPTWSLRGGSDLDHRSWASQVLMYKKMISSGHGIALRYICCTLYSDSNCCTYNLKLLYMLVCILWMLDVPAFNRICINLQEN